MRTLKPSPRAEYREQQHLRAKHQPTIADRFAELSALTAEFAYRNPDGTSRNREVKFTVNIHHASSLFRIDCLNPDCVQGDYDLSDVLRQAVTSRQRTVTGELCCEGWQDRFSIDHTRCHQRIRFTLTLEFRES
jgi:hypothetical protein